MLLRQKRFPGTRSVRPHSFLARGGSGDRNDHDLVARDSVRRGFGDGRGQGLLLCYSCVSSVLDWPVGSGHFSAARLALFVIDSLLETGYSGEIEPARKFAGEVFASKMPPRRLPKSGFALLQLNIRITGCIRHFHCLGCPEVMNV